MQSTPLHILLIIGSIRNGRHTHKVAHYLHQVLEKNKGIEVHVWDLAEESVPLLTDQWKKLDSPPPLLVQKGQQLSKADGIILCSPEYHGSFTGVLKNALDHFWKEFSRKPMGVVATGSGPMGGINASTEMQLLILALGGFPMPKKLLAPQVQQLFDEQGSPKESSFVDKTQDFVKEYLWFVRALKE